MAEVYVKKVGSNSSPIFSAQVVDDTGASTYRQVPVSNVNYVSSASQSEITQYIIDNAANSTSEELTGGAAIIAQRNFDKERSNIAGMTSANGTQNTYDTSMASKIWNTINPFSDNFLGIDRGPAPDDKPSLVAQSQAGDKNVVKGTTTIKDPKFDQYGKPITNINKNPTYRDVIGGADMSLFFIMSYPSADVDNLKLPKSQQIMENVIIEMDNVLSISYQTIREVFPVRNLGTINPAAHIKGIRTITGNIAFTIFTDDPLAYLRAQVAQRMKQINDSFTSFGKSIAKKNKADNDYNEKLKQWEEYRSYYQKFINQVDKVQLLDNLDSFTLLAMGTNEQGSSSKLMLKEVSIIDENQYIGTQQPHAINKVTFTATDIVPMASFEQGQIAVASIDSTDTSFINGTWNSNFNFSNEVTGTKALDDISKDLYKNNKIGG